MSKIKKTSSKNTNSINKRKGHDSVFEAFLHEAHEAINKQKGGGHKIQAGTVPNSVSRSPRGSPVLSSKMLSQLREDLVKRLGFIAMEEKAVQYRKDRYNHLHALALSLICLYLFLGPVQYTSGLVTQSDAVVSDSMSQGLSKLHNIVTTFNSWIKPIANSSVLKPLYGASFEGLITLIITIITRGNIPVSKLKTMTRVQWYITLTLIVGYYLSSFTKGKDIFFLDAYWTIRDMLNNTIKTADLDKMMKNIIDVYSMTINTTGSLDKLSMNTITVGHTTVKIIKEMIEKYNYAIIIMLAHQGLPGLRALHWIIFNWRFDANKQGEILKAKQEQLLLALDESFGVLEIEYKVKDRLLELE